MRHLLLACLAISCVACGRDDDKDTRFGDADDVLAYRQALEPIIVEVSAIENEVTARAVNSDSVAIDADIAPVYEELRPRLLAVRDSLSTIQPPRQLRQLHDDILHMVQLRLDAYQRVIDGFSTGDIAQYDIAVENLRLANEAILAINEQLHAIDDALTDHDTVLALAPPGSVCFS